MVLLYPGENITISGKSFVKPSNGFTRVPLWSEYEEWSKGRVIYNTQTEKFMVYADRQLLKKIAQKEISKIFCLPNPNTKYYSNSHYKSFRIIPYL